MTDPLSFDCADGVHCYCWHDRGHYACCECEEVAPPGYGEPEESDEPLDMDEISKRWSEAARDGGTLRWNPIIADLIIEVERLRAEPLGTCPTPDDMPEGAIPIYMGIRDRPTHCIGWVNDPSMGTLASLLRLVADELEEEAS